jgi:hypothetical protein
MMKFIRFCQIGVMLILAQFSFSLLRDMKDVLVISSLGAESILHLKLAQAPLGLALGALLIVCARGGTQRVLSGFFGVGALLLLGSYGALQMGWISYDNPSFAIAFYLVSSVYAALSIVLVWAYAAERYTFRAAVVQYPALAILATSVGTVFAAYAVMHICSGADFEVSLGTVLTSVGASYSLLFMLSLLATSDTEGSAGHCRLKWWALPMAIALFAVGIAQVQQQMGLQFKAWVPEKTEYLYFATHIATYKGPMLLSVGLPFTVMLGFALRDGGWKCFGNVCLAAWAVLLIYAGWCFCVTRLMGADIIRTAFLVVTEFHVIIFVIKVFVLELPILSVEPSARFRMRIAVYGVTGLLGAIVGGIWMIISEGFDIAATPAGATAYPFLIALIGAFLLRRALNSVPDTTAG